MSSSYAATTRSTASLASTPFSTSSDSSAFTRSSSKPGCSCSSPIAPRLRRRLEVRLPDVDEHRRGRLGHRAPDLAGLEADRVAPVRVLSCPARVRVRERRTRRRSGRRPLSGPRRTRAGAYAHRSPTAGDDPVADVEAPRQSISRRGETPAYTTPSMASANSGSSRRGTGVSGWSASSRVRESISSSVSTPCSTSIARQPASSARSSSCSCRRPAGMRSIACRNSSTRADIVPNAVCAMPKVRRSQSAWTGSSASTTTGPRPRRPPRSLADGTARVCQTSRSCKAGAGLGRRSRPQP